MTGTASGAVLARRVIAGLPPWPVAIWLILTVGALAARPPLAPTEAQVLSVAWEMWRDGALLPSLNGTPLDAQPPLLYWLICGAWAVFGVSEVVARLVAPLFGLGTLLLMAPLARLLWPGRPTAGQLAGILLAGTGGFAVYSAMSMPALPATFFSSLGLYGLALAWRRTAAGWLIYGAALGLAFLVGGAAAALLLLAPALAAPLWHEQRTKWARWYGGLAAAWLLALPIVLAWLVPVLGQGGTPGNFLFAEPPLAGAFGGPPRPVYWMVLALVLALYPWLLWKTLWRAAGRSGQAWREPGFRLALAAAAAALLVALAINWREAEGLLPLLPPLALAASRLLDNGGRRPHDFHALLPGLLALLVGLFCFLLNIVPVAHLDAVWREFISERGLPIWLGGISLASGLVLLGGSYLLAQMTPAALVSRTAQLALLPVLMVSTLNLEFAISLRDFFDLGRVAEQIHDLQRDGRPVAVYGAYGGEFGFPGRLAAPLTLLPSTATAIGWAAENPAGVVVSSFQGGVLHMPAEPLYLGEVADTWAALWPAEAVTATDGAVLRRRF